VSVYKCVCGGGGRPLGRFVLTDAVLLKLSPLVNLAMYVRVTSPLSIPLQILSIKSPPLPAAVEPVES
jgi:hypothetical protein